MIDRIDQLATLFRQRAMAAGSDALPDVHAATLADAPVDRVTLSSQAGKARNAAKAGPRQETELTAEEKQRLDDLKKQDQAVKAHEQAHIAAGGDAVRGAASYQYQIGPDGQQYAVGGEVQIDVSPERSPKATIRKMEQIIQAALAPAQPSGTDRAVAARAAQVEAQARLQMAEGEKTGKDPSTSKAFDTSENTALSLYPHAAYPAEQKSERHSAIGERVDLMA